MKHKFNKLTGTLLGDYLIQETIGKGTFGKVKYGIYLPTNDKVAIKILEKNKIREKDDIERVLREMNIIKNFSHSNVIKVFEIIEDSDNYYIIMEYCDGGELFNYIVKKKRLSEEESSYYFYQIINGLEYIHTFNVAHRDLKPENLLLSDEKILKIIDFGLSNYFKLDGTGELLKTPCGSPCYASPEMVAGKKYNGFNIDVWSTGIILYAMLCGYLPFEDPDNEILFKKILACNLSFPSYISPLSKDLIKKILVTNPEERIKISEIKQHPFYLQGKTIFKIEHPAMDKTRMNKRQLTLGNGDNKANVLALSSNFSTECDKSPSEMFSSMVTPTEPSTCPHKVSLTLNSFLSNAISPKNKYQTSESQEATEVERKNEITIDQRKMEGKGKNIPAINMLDTMKMDRKRSNVKRIMSISKANTRLGLNTVRISGVSTGRTSGSLMSPVHKKENIASNLKKETKKSNSITINNAIINVNMIEPNFIVRNVKVNKGHCSNPYSYSKQSQGGAANHFDNKNRYKAIISKSEQKELLSFNSLDFNSINLGDGNKGILSNNWYKASDKTTQPEIKIHDIKFKKDPPSQRAPLITSYGINLNSRILSTKGKYLPSISKKFSNESCDLTFHNKILSNLLDPVKPQIYLNTEVSEGDKYQSKQINVLKLSEFMKGNSANLKKIGNSSTVGPASTKGKRLTSTLIPTKDNVKLFNYKAFLSKIGVK